MICVIIGIRVIFLSNTFDDKTFGSPKVLKCRYERKSVCDMNNLANVCIGPFFSRITIL